MTDIIGIDPSLSATGIARADWCLTVRTNDKAPRGERLADIYAAIHEHAAGADVAVIEGYSRGSLNRREDAGEVGGVIRMALWQLGVPYVEVPPMSVKKFACGGQKDRDKDAMQHGAWQAGSSAKTNDQADAWWLRQMGLAAYGLFPTQFKYRKEAIAAIEWPMLQEDVA